MRIGFDLVTPSSVSKPSAILCVKLFAEWNRHDDILLAEGQVQVPVDPFVTDEDFPGVSVMPKLRPLALTAILVRLIPSATHPLEDGPHPGPQDHRLGPTHGQR